MTVARGATGFREDAPDEPDRHTSVVQVLRRVHQGGLGHHLPAHGRHPEPRPRPHPRAARLPPQRPRWLSDRPPSTACRRPPGPSATAGTRSTWCAPCPRHRRHAGPVQPSRRSGRPSSTPSSPRPTTGWSPTTGSFRATTSGTTSAWTARPGRRTGTRPYFDYTAEFCAKYDQVAFDADYRSAPLDHYEPLIRSFFAPKGGIEEISQLESANGRLTASGLTEGP